MKYKLSLKKFGDVLEHENVSVDPEWGISDVLNIVNAHNSGWMNAEEHVWTGTKDSYCYVPESAPALIWEEIYDTEEVKV
jgi:hypothetical protein